MPERGPLFDPGETPDDSDKMYDEFPADTRLVPVTTFANRIEADVARGVLESQGIRSAIAADEYAGVLLLTSGGVQLLVMEDDAKMAAKILAVHMAKPNV